MNLLTITYRQQFLKELFPRVRNLRYAFLKYFYDSLDEIPLHTDIDLLVDASELINWKQVLQDSPNLRSVVFRDTSFASYAELYFTDDSYLEIDLIHQIKWKKWEFLEAERLLGEATTKQEGIKIATPIHSFLYVIYFYSLNQTEVPNKYQQAFDRLNAFDQQEVLQHFQQLLNSPTLSKQLVFRLGSYQPLLKSAIKKLAANRGFSGIKNYIHSWRELFTHPQPTISFSGVDGAGKSTILAHTQELLSTKYRCNIVLLRQRPSILPILSSFKYGKAQAESRAANTLPRTGTNRSTISSLLRFGWYYLDYIVGQFWVKWTVNKRGRVLLYDRYYFDYIVDSKRANIRLHPSFIRKLYAAVFKPELNFVLYASPEIILARKQELSASDIVQLTISYRELFQDLQRQHPHVRYIEINNTELTETMQQIEAAYVAYMSQRKGNQTSTTKEQQ